MILRRVSSNFIKHTRQFNTRGIHTIAPLYSSNVKRYNPPHLSQTLPIPVHNKALYRDSDNVDGKIAIINGDMTVFAVENIESKDAKHTFDTMFEIYDENKFTDGVIVDLTDKLKDVVVDTGDSEKRYADGSSVKIQ